ncbi:MAG TPA: CoA transferase [Casimicrobiaceae bacterium]|nr:CoA transferase [Casimicrobiaceae bacterium]
MAFRPLAGVVCVEVGHDVSAAFGARLLADLGAEVIKVEAPGAKDAGRASSPVALHGESALFGYLNYGKRSVTIDTAKPAGAALLEDLLRRAELVICAPGASGAMPLPSALERFDPVTRPTLVCVSAHGLLGPRAGQPSSPLVLQHSSGFAFHQASPVSDPAATPPTAGADMEGALAIGIVVANAALWALSAVEPGEPKPFVDLSAEDVYTYLLVEPFADWAAGLPTRERQRDPGKPSMVAGGLVWLLPCADGAVMVSPREDHQWERWVEVMGRPEWTRDAALCGDRTIRAQHATAIGEKMSAWSVHQKAQEVFAKAQAQRVACFPVSSARDMVQNAQLIDRGFYSRLRLSSDLVIPAAGLPFKLRTSGGATLERGGEVKAPDLGEGNRDVFATRLGLDANRIEHLERQRVI